MTASANPADVKAFAPSSRSIIPALFSVFLVLAGCAEQQPDSAEFFVFGTLVEVSLADGDAATRQAAFQDLQGMFQAMHRDWHAWEPGMLGDINRAFASGSQALASEQLAQLIRQSGELEAASGGRFNPAIGRLVGLWGFHTSDYPIRQALPGRDAIDSLLAAHPSTQDIELLEADKRTWWVSSRNPSVQLDFGGVAKGYAVDLAIARLRARGINHAIVNAGGDLRAIGRNQGRDWRIAVENPLGGLIGVVETTGDEAVFTSGNYQRFAEDASGKRYAHILDPCTGWPVADVMSATVIAENGTVADAAATALVVAGLDEWSEVAQGMGLEQVLLTDSQGRVHLTRAMQARLQPAADVTQRMVLLD